MCSICAHAKLVISTVIVAAGALDVSPCLGQTRVTSLEELRRELTAGDLVTIDHGVGPPVEGRLLRFGSVDLEVRPANTHTSQQRDRPGVTIPLADILSLERRRDSARNGAAIGAGIGAGYGAAMFVHAVVIDRNEMSEWAALYAGAAAACTGIGALIGWAIDASSSKAPIRFDAAGGRTAVSVQPMYSQGRGIGLAVTFSR